MERIETLRRQRLTGKAIAAEIGGSPATVSRVLKRLSLNKLKALEPAEPVRRYEREPPGELIHIDIKKLGKFNRIGHRITGDRNSQNKTHRSHIRCHSSGPVNASFTVIKTGAPGGAEFMRRSCLALQVPVGKKQREAAMRMTDWLLVGMLADANRSSTQSDAQGCMFLMLPMGWEMLGVFIAGGLAPIAILPRASNPFVMLGLAAASAIAAILAYRQLHLLARRIKPLRIGLIVLSGIVWTIAVWYVLPRLEGNMISALIIFSAAAAWKALNMRINEES